MGSSLVWRKCCYFYFVLLLNDNLHILIDLLIDWL